MNADLIKRLRGERYWVDGVEFPDPLSTEAADALTAAQEENERLVHDIERLSASLSAEVTENEKLRKATEALGVMPEGYCFCSRHRIGDDSKIHEPECADLRSALNGLPR